MLRLEILIVSYQSFFLFRRIGLMLLQMRDVGQERKDLDKTSSAWSSKSVEM